MKKIISFVSLLAILLSFCVISVGADDNAFTMKDAHALFLEAYKRFSIFQGQGLYDYVDLNEEDFNDWDENKQCIAYSKTEIVRYYASSDGKAYNDEDGYCYAPFFTVPDFPSDFKTDAPYNHIDEDFNYVFKSIDDVENYLSEIFTDTLVKKSRYIYIDIVSDSLDIVSDRVEMFRYSENNELLLYYDNSNYGRTSIAALYAPISLKVNKNKAVLIIDFYAYGTDSYPESVEFVKENGVWKISGGTVFGYLLGENDINTLNYNPSTGDTSSYTAPALTVAAIISVALPVTLLRKRRRVV